MSGGLCPRGLLSGKSIIRGTVSAGWMSGWNVLPSNIRSLATRCLSVKGRPTANTHTLTRDLDLESLIQWSWHSTYLLTCLGSLPKGRLDAYIFLCTELFLKIANKKLIRRWDTRTWHHFILRLMPPREGFPRDDFRKILHADQTMAKIQNGEEILPKVSTPWVGRTNVTDDRRVCDSKDPNGT